MCDVSFCSEAAACPAYLISHYNQTGGGGAYNTSMNLSFPRVILDISSYVLAADCHLSPSSEQLRWRRRKKSVISAAVAPARPFTGPINRPSVNRLVKRDLDYVEVGYDSDLGPPWARLMCVHMAEVAILSASEG